MSSSLNERRLRTLIDATSSVFFIAKPDGRMVEPQPSWERYTGQRWPSYRGLGWLEAVHRDDLDLSAPLVARAAARGLPLPLDVRLWHERSRSFRHVRGQAVPLFTEDGELVEWVGSLEDVHDRLVAQRRLEETASRLDALLRNSPVGVAFFDRDLRVVLVNEALARAGGLDDGDHAGRHVDDLVAPLARGLGEHLRAVLRTGERVTDVELRGLVLPDREDGRDLLVSCYPVSVPDGELLGVGLIVVDVTERNALQALVHEVSEREARDRFRAALDTMFDQVLVLSSLRDERGRIIDFRIDYVNQHGRDPAGRTRDRLIGRTFSDAYPASAGSALLDRYTDVVETREPLAIEALPYVDVLDGRPVQALFAQQVAPFEDGVIVASRDVSGRRRRQVQLQRAYEQLAAAQRLAHIGIWEIDLAGGRVSFSDELRRIFGLSEQAGPDDFADVVERFVVAEDRERLRALFEEAPRTGQPFAIEIGIAREDGEVRVVNIFGTTELQDERPLRLWGTIQDVTDARLAEEQLREAAVRLERERAVVTGLQQAFLPAAPRLPGLEIAVRYLPAGVEATVGGDWYDVFSLDERRVAFVVGDVAGHGLPAAALMAQLRNALRGAAFAGQGPDETMRTVNTMLLRTAGDAMATCLFGVYDLRTSLLRWSSAGHPPPLVVRPGVGVRLLADPPGPPLGMPGGRYHTYADQLPSGSTLVLYTDGLIEERSRSIDEGLDQLVELAASLDGLPVESACEKVARSMFAARTRADDVCLLIARPT